MRFVFTVFMAIALLPAYQSLPDNSMREAAGSFIESLEAGRRDDARLAFDDSDRFDWSYFPGGREGLPLKEMNPVQRDAAFALMRSALSDSGFQKAQDVIALETVLRQMGGGSWRDPERYYFVVFGDPQKDELWGWRVEGHHLSLNFTSVYGLISSTPSFWGANPARIPLGPDKGKRVLKQEEELAQALMQSLNEKQKTAAWIRKSAPADILTANDETVDLDAFEGLPFNTLNASQQEMLKRLVYVYIDAMNKTVAARAKEGLENSGWHTLYFAWAGGLAPGEKHYYRIHGPRLLIEYDNTQNNANHIHSVWRDPQNDFGRDDLREHYRKHHHE